MAAGNRPLSADSKSASMYRVSPLKRVRLYTPPITQSARVCIVDGSANDAI